LAQLFEGALGSEGFNLNPSSTFSIMVIGPAVRMLQALGVAGCAEREKDVQLGKPDFANLASYGGKTTPSAMSTMSTCTPSTTPGSASVGSYSSVSRNSKPGSGLALDLISTDSNLPAGHWLLPYRKWAGSPKDLDLLDAFLRLAKVPSGVINTPKNAKLLLKMLRFLHSLDMDPQDLKLLLAHASIYFEDIHAACGATMSHDEVANVLVLLAFLAQCHLLDETCQLKVWHHYLFSGYCSLPMLSKATMQLMKRRKYVLRVGEEELGMAMARLEEAVNRVPDPYYQQYEDGEGPITSI